MTPVARRAVLSSSAFVILSAVLLGCGTAVSAPASEPHAADAITVENCGREVAVPQAPKAAVAMHPAQMELMARLGLSERVVARAQVGAQELPADVAPLADSIPALGGLMPPSREELLAAEPDFVYSPTTYEFSAEQGFASIEQLEQSGAAVYVAAGGCADRRMAGKVTDLFTDIAALGTLFGVQDAAAELIASAQADLAAVHDATKALPPLRVAQVYVEGETLQAIGAGVEYDILQRAGVDNVYGPDQAEFADFFAATISPESLAAQAPDALVFSVYDAAQEKATRDYLKRTFPQLPAVVNDRLIAVPGADMFPGTLGNVAVVRTIAEKLYPQAF